MSTINEAVALLIEKAISGIDASVSFLQAEIPDVVHQLLLWQLVSNAATCFIGVALLVGSVFWLNYQWKYWSTPIEYHGRRVERWEGSSGAFIANIFILLPITWGLCLLNLTWLQILIAPKVYLIEYAATLFK